MNITKLEHDEKNRMAGVRWGLHDGHWYLRFDLWWKSFRLTGKRE